MSVRGAMTGTRCALVDAFTRIPGEGNRAGIVPEADGLDEGAMMRTAAAMAASATAFLLTPSEDGAVRLRAFTPHTELPFCGHATVASFHWLAEAGALPAGGRLALECPMGRVPVELEMMEDGGVRVWMTTPRQEWEPGPIAGATLLGLLGGSQGMRDTALPIERAGRFLFVALSRRADLWGLVPRWEALAAEGERHGVGGFYVFTRDTLESGSVSHGRHFIPSSPIREDPVTGSISGPLAEYLARHGVVALPAEGGTVRARAEQGDAIGRPGRVELEVTGAPGRVEAMRVGGVAVTVLEGTLRT